MCACLAVSAVYVVGASVIRAELSLGGELKGGGIGAEVGIEYGAEGCVIAGV